jgi:hypothetical protein
LYIIGAGCSRNYAQSTCNIVGLKSPLNNDFFTMAKKVAASGNPRIQQFSNGVLNSIVKRICQFYGYPANHGIDVFDDPRLELEDVMTTFSLEAEIFEKKFSYALGEGYHHELVSSLGELVAITLAVALQGPVCEKHKKLANSMSSGDVIISFNYDLLLDNALFETNNLTDTGYNIPFLRKYNIDNWLRPDETRSKIQLLKLHGSMNWLRCTICGSDLLLQRTKYVDIFLGSSSWFNCPRCGASDLYMKRIMLPPLLTKAYDDVDINYLWLRAEELLDDTDKIIAIGYSLPTADFASRMLFRRAIASGKISKNTPLIVVNPDPQVKSIFTSLFNSSKIHHFNSLDEYLAQLQPS